MSTEGSIPPGPHEGGGNHNPHYQTTQEHNQKPVNDLTTAETNKVVKPRLIPWIPGWGSKLIESNLVWIFWIIGGDFQGAGHKVPGYMFNCLSVMCLLLLMAELVFAQWPNRKWILFWLFIAWCGPVAIYGSFCVAEFRPVQNKGTWQPPELPKDCKVIRLRFGDYPFSAKPDQLTTKTPNYEALFPTCSNFFRPYIRNNRLYLEANIFMLGRHTIRMDDHCLDTLITHEKWDINFDSNKFEVVVQTGTNLVPVLQVIYQQPNEIILNGIFADPHKSGKVLLAFPEGFKSTLGVPETIRKRLIFKYPRWQYPGQMSDDPGKF